MRADILVFGSGQLSKVFCYSIAVLKVPKKLVIKVVSRSKTSAQQIASICNIRARLVENQVTFVADEVNWGDNASIKKVLVATSPIIIFHTSSLQSPWEIFLQNSKWANLVSQAGFGVTLPLQAFLVTKVAAMIEKLNLESLLVNACYPDAVNPFIKASGLDVTCGIGNISIIAAVINSYMRGIKKEELKILAHHLHIKPSRKITVVYGKPRVWVNNRRINLGNETSLIISKIKGSELNQITGLTAIEVILALLSHDTKMLNIPGPNGLPGGYPVIISYKKVELSLPKGVLLEDAILWNKACGDYDGVVIENDGYVKYSSAAQKILYSYGFKYADGFHQHQLKMVCNDMLKLRNS